MAKCHFGWAAALMVATVTCLDHPPVRAADGPGNETLKKLGVKMAGMLVVSEMEGEVKTKLADARRLSRQLSQSVMEQQAMTSPREQQRNIKALNEQISQLKSEMNAVNQQMTQVPRNNSQYGTSYGNAIGGYGGGWADLAVELAATAATVDMVATAAAAAPQVSPTTRRPNSTRSCNFIEISSRKR